MSLLSIHTGDGRKTNPPPPQIFGQVFDQIFVQILARFLIRDAQCSFAGSTGAKIQFYRSTGTNTNTVLQVLREILLFIFYFFFFFFFGGAPSTVYVYIKSSLFASGCPLIGRLLWFVRDHTEQPVPSGPPRQLFAFL